MGKKGGNSGGGKVERGKRGRSHSEESGDREDPKMVRLDEEEFKIIFKFSDGMKKVPNSLKLSSEIRDKIGGILHAKILSNGNVLIFCKSEAQRCNALKLKELDNRAVQGFVPGLGQEWDQGSKGVIYIDTGISEAELLKNLKGGEIVGVKRFKTRREGVEESSTAVLIFFKDEIQPQRVYLGFMAYQVRPYVRPPLRCYKCQRFGHVAAVCRGEGKCGKCGEGHDRSECTSSDAKCCNCGGNHVAAYRGCGAYIQAQQVENIKKTEHLSYSEAVRKVKVSRSGNSQVSSFNVAESNKGVGRVSDSHFVVDKTGFLAFLVEILWAVRQVKTSSDIKAIISKEADRFLSVEVPPEHLNLAYVQNKMIRPKGSQMSEEGPLVS